MIIFGLGLDAVFLSLLLFLYLYIILILSALHPLAFVLSYTL